jgi:GDP-L-fucose synthase
MLNLAHKCVVVTGGAGFLGRYVIEGLQRCGCRRIEVPRIEEYDGQFR